MLNRTNKFLIIVAITQGLNFCFMGYCIARGNFLPSIIIGGLGRAIMDGFLLYMAWKGKKWAKYLIAFLWACVVVAACILWLIFPGGKVNSWGICSVIIIYLSLTMVVLTDSDPAGSGSQ